MNMFDLSLKNVLVTGGGSGIGRSICELFAQQGATVYILDRNEEAGRETQEAIEKEGKRAFILACDVGNNQQVHDVVQEIYQRAGSIDILINNAGISHIGNVESTTEKDLDLIYQINIKGVFNCLHEVVPVMKAQGGGVILNMTSIAAMVGISDRFAYSMSKGAVLAMTMSTAKDYLSHNIRCNCISPGRVHTPFVDSFLKKSYPGREEEMFEKLSKTQPIGRMGKPEEVAMLALYLCSDKAGFITGTNYPIDGGFVTLNS